MPEWLPPAISKSAVTATKSALLILGILQRLPLLHCHLLRPVDDLQGMGAALGSADLAAVRRFLEEFTVRSLLPHLEARLRAVNFQVGPH